MKSTRKLIETAIPLEAINKASAREKSIRHAHPSTLHLWWARRPLAAARAVLFAQIVDDPSSNPERFPTEQEQEAERQRLFRILSDLVAWENTTNEEVLDRARAEIREAWRRACEANAGHPDAAALFDPDRPPAFHDPFAGGGTLPLEAQRLGLDTIATDLNPVAVLLNKAMIEIPPRFAGRPPVHPLARGDEQLIARRWFRARGLAEDVSRYGRWMRDRAERRLGSAYPRIEVTAGMAHDRPDLRPHAGKKLTVIAWLWARTVRSPNPAFAHVDVPLVTSFLLSGKEGREAYVEPVIERDGYRFAVRAGKPSDPAAARLGTTAGKRNAFRCVMSDVPIPYEHIRSEGKAGRLGARLMAILAEGERGRVVLSPTPEHEEAARATPAGWKPDIPLPANPRDFKTPNYGLATFGDLFTPRQLLALTTFADLVEEARAQAHRDALAAGLAEDGRRLSDGGSGAAAYADAVAVYLGLGVGRCANYWSSLTPWGGEFIVQTFGRQALPMVWDYAEGNPFSGSTGNWTGAIDWIVKVIAGALPAIGNGAALQADARTPVAIPGCGERAIVSTDPPYYDNIAYADLSDYFYIWLRRALRPALPDLFPTVSVPKAEELVATPYRHGGREKAEAFFLDGMAEALRRIAERAHPAFPVTIYYAFKQAETGSESGTASTGWEAFLDAVIRAGFAVTGTWPIRTERDQGLKTGSNVLASSIVLVCRPRAGDAPAATRREFLAALKAELPAALAQLRRGNIAPVDLAQASIGPGMAVFTRYARVVEADGAAVSVRGALALINESLDAALTEQEGAFDAGSRWALAWFEQVGFGEGDYGAAETLSKAKNTSVAGMVEAGIVRSRGGKVRLLKPEELPGGWDPDLDGRLTVWEAVHYLIRALDSRGEEAAAVLAGKLGPRSEAARELAYRLYVVCERRNRAKEGAAYNALVRSWPEILRLARDGAATKAPRRHREAPLFTPGAADPS